MKVKNNNSELHLMILWNNARYKENEILSDIKKQKNLKIIECIDIQWTPSLVADNFTRFYGVKLDKGSHKEKECGTGSFLLILLLDKNPIYKEAQTSRGPEVVNINLFNLKSKYREWTRGGHKIHATNSPQETNHDITLLLDKNYDDYLAVAPKKWDNKIKKIKKDLIGSNGWKNLPELFYTLNATINYEVLRNAEVLPEQFKSDLHGDIDILTDNYKNMCFIVNSKPVFSENYRVHNYTMINNQKVLFDFRYLGDNYYCDKFEKDLLEKRKLNEKGIYVIDDEYLFYSLVYHALIHKKVIASDYYDKIYNLFLKLGFDKIYDINKYKNPFDLYFIMLSDFMIKNNYTYTKPNDVSVFFNKDLLNLEQVKLLQEKFKLKNIAQYYPSDISAGGYSFYTAEYNNEKLFIKSGKLKEYVKNEYEVANTLYKINKDNFLKPYGFDNKLVLFEFVEGENVLKFLANSNNCIAYKKKIVLQLEDIAKSLIKANIVHRDIRPENLMVTKDGTVKLIDYQWAVSLDNYKELKCVSNNIEDFSELGCEYKMAQYCWDDMYSLHMIIKEIGEKSDFITSNIGSYKIQYNINEVIESLICKLNENNVTSKTKKYPRWFVNIITLFMFKKKNRKHFREKYLRK